MARGTPGPPGCWGKLAACCSDICAPGPPAEEAPHARLERLVREREEERRRSAERAAEAAEESERKAQEWQAELAELERRRAGMCDEELEKDCLEYFAAFEVLSSASQPPEPAGGRSPAEAAPQDGPPPTRSGSDLAVGARVHGQHFGSLRAPSRGEPGADPTETTGETVEVPPEGHVELWLAHLFGRDCAEPASPGARALAANGWSFGELDGAACDAMAPSLRDALTASAEEAEAAESESRNRTLKASVSTKDLSERLDQLVQKYAPEDGAAGASPEASARAEEPDGPATAASAAAATEALRARAVQHRAVRDRVQSLLPCLEGDAATARLVVALATLDLGTTAAASRPARTAGASFRAPLAALSTADACWALCSESRRLVFERMLPVTSAGESWFWPDLRRTAVGWWLCGSDCLELLDRLITKIAQTKVLQLRRHLEKDKEWDMDMARTSQGVSKGYVDEALFWHALLGTKITALRALMRTGLLASEPGIAALLQHKSVGDAEFLRKNAFRLLQLHRYYLAAALFVMSDSMDEAVRVVAGHLRDLQLGLLITRRCREVARPLLRDTLRESSLAQRDPWLRLLLGWHLGDAEVVAQCGQEAPPAAADAGDVQGALTELFGEVLRCSRYGPGLRKVASKAARELSGARA